MTSNARIPPVYLVWGDMWPQALGFLQRPIIGRGGHLDVGSVRRPQQLAWAEDAEAGGAVASAADQCIGHTGHRPPPATRPSPYSGCRGRVQPRPSGGRPPQLPLCECCFPGPGAGRETPTAHFYLWPMLPLPYGPQHPSTSEFFLGGGSSSAPSGLVVWCPGLDVEPCPCQASPLHALPPPALGCLCPSQSPLAFRQPQLVGQCEPLGFGCGARELPGHPAVVLPGMDPHARPGQAAVPCAPHLGPIF